MSEVSPHAPTQSLDSEIFKNRTVLIVDDETTVRTVFSMILEEDDCLVVEAETVADAKRQLAAGDFDLVVIDKNLPDDNGLELLRHMVDAGYDCATVMITGYANVESAVEAMRLGAADYITKPFPDIEVVRSCLRRALKLHGLEQDNRALVAELRDKNVFLQDLAVRDPMTQLFNHGHLRELLDTELTRSRAQEGVYSLLLVAIDGFKKINDQRGHVVGDQLLRELAVQLANVNELADEAIAPGGEVTAARYGGDIFALILADTPKPDAAALAERLRTSVARSDFDALGITEVTVSVGVASYPTDSTTAIGLVEAADVALYTAKNTGRNRAVTYVAGQASIKSGHSERVGLEAKWLEAIDRTIAGRLFNMVYQSIVRSSDHSVFAYEALCRPRDPVFPNPMALIQSAERCGRTAALGRVLRQDSVHALEQLPRGSQLFINLHPDDLRDPEFIAIEPFLAQWAEMVVFEITEVARIASFGAVSDAIAHLRANGFRVALDDLGSGYSGLNTLAQLEPDFVKLDMALVRSASRDRRTRRLVKHILEFAADEGMQVIAEGIETEEERKVVVDLGCPLLQGWLFAKGEPLAVILDKLAERDARASAT